MKLIDIPQLARHLLRAVTSGGIPTEQSTGSYRPVEASGASLKNVEPNLAKKVMRYKYPTDIVEPLRAEWYEWRRREGDIPELPTDEQLQALLEIAYHASFTADEQRRTHFDLVLCEANQAHNPFRFSSPRDLTPHEIMRLAPVVGVTRSMLGVEIIDGTPRIWGFCDSAFMQLVVTVRGPGSIHVGRNREVLVALEGGKFTDAYSRPNVFQAVIESLEPGNQALWEDINWPGGAWSPYAETYPGLFHDALSTIRQAGHGGTILLVRESEATSRPWSRILHIKYECNDSSIWPELRKAVLKYDEKAFGDPDQNATSEAAETRARELITRVAGLAAVDGAVLVTDRLRVLGFGVEVLAPAKITTIELLDGTTREVTAYGTRHRSAFRFCEAYPRGAAFVCSQDGGIKCIRNIDGRVRVWQE